MSHLELLCRRRMCAACVLNICVINIKCNRVGSRGVHKKIYGVHKSSGVQVSTTSQSARDVVEDRRTNFIVSQEILRFNRQGG
jgi:hypothetical protein